MELHKLTAEDIRGFDAAKLKETETEIRREMVNVRMDIYTAKGQTAGKVVGLRRALARLLTVKNAAPRPAKVAAPKADAKPAAKKKTKSAKPASAKKTAAPKRAAKASTKTK